MTLSIRPGVKWSNGTPFSESDVAFTFEMMKKYPATNLSALSIASVSSPSATKVVVNFTEPAYQQLYNIVGTLTVRRSCKCRVHAQSQCRERRPLIGVIGVVTACGEWRRG